MAHIDLPIPKNKKPSEYNYKERRAEILDIIIKAGIRDRVNQTELASRYGVKQPQISRDIAILKKRLRRVWVKTFVLILTQFIVVLSGTC